MKTFFSSFLVMFCAAVWAQPGHLDTTFNSAIPGTLKGFLHNSGPMLQMDDDTMMIYNSFYLDKYNGQNIKENVVIDKFGNYIRTLDSQEWEDYFQGMESSIYNHFLKEDLILWSDGFFYAANSVKLAKYDRYWNLVKKLYSFPPASSQNFGYNHVSIRKSGNSLFLQLNNKIIRFENEVLVNDNVFTYTPNNPSIDYLDGFEIDEADSSLYIEVKYGNLNTNAFIKKYSWDGEPNNDFQSIEYNYAWSKRNFFLKSGKIYLHQFPGHIQRYFNNGAEDLTFTKIPMYEYLFDLELDLNDNVLVIDILPPFAVKKYNPYGVFDPTFYQEMLYDNLWVEDLDVLSNGDIMLSGNLPTVGNKWVGNIARLHGEGPYDCNQLELKIKKTTPIQCNAPGFVLVEVNGGIEPVTYSLNGTPLANKPDSLVFSAKGYQTLSAMDASGCYKEVTFFIGGETYAPNQFDLSVHFTTSTLVRGFENNAAIIAQNLGCQAKDAELTFNLPVNIDLVSALPAPSQANGNTYRWTLNALKEATTINLVLKPSALIPFGQEKVFTLSINPIEEDLNPNNNIKNYVFTINGSYDPNDIAVYPKGSCDPRYVKEKEVMTYTIRFQNTGNFPASHVYVLDSISPAFDLNTLRLVSASHNMNVLRPRSNVLQFDFPNIQLPGLEQDSVGSIGYVMFEIGFKEDAPHHEAVYQQAAIYFDFNDAVITNSVFNTVTDSIPVFSNQVILRECGGQDLVIGETVVTTDTSFVVNLISHEGCDSAVWYQVNFEEIPAIPMHVSDNQIITSSEFEAYTWVDCATNEIVEEATSHIFAAEKTGNYAVQVKKGDCIYESNCVFILVTSFEEIEENKGVKIFPNPVFTGQDVTIQCTKQPIKSEVLDIDGKLAAKINQPLRHPFHNDLSPGIYVLRFYFEDGVVEKKMVVLK